MGECLVIRADILAAPTLLKVIGDVRDLYWETSSHHRDVMARWLPKKGFKIIPKILDAGYKPGTVGDDADKLITRMQACYLGNPGGREELIPVWNSDILVQPQTREELKRILDKNILDMSFEEEVVRDMGEKHRRKANYPVNEQTLNGDNENLKDLAKILMRLAQSINKAKADLKKKGDMPVIDFEFYIPRE